MIVCLIFEIQKNLGLYIHIPFCRSLCGFCPYCKTLYEKKKADLYTEALLTEIDLVGGSAGNDKKEVTSLYFGGGTPALPSNDIKRIIERIERYFTITEGIGLELHPSDVTAEKLAVLKASGVTKISIGIQSFQPDYLNMLGRTGTDYNAMFEALSKFPFETVSMDFIFALPGQTAELLKKDIETAFSNGANHFAIYPFIDFTFATRTFENMDDEDKQKLLYDVVAYCNEKGYVRDSIWTFSKRGTSKYSSMTRENFLGFGSSATTLLENQFKINTFSIDEYMSRIEKRQLPTALTIHFTMRQRMVYYLFWTAYSMQIDPNSFKDFFGRRLESCYGFELLAAKMLGFVTKENGHYRITTKGSYYYHYYENFYTLSYIDQMWNLMKNEAFPTELLIK